MKIATVGLLFLVSVSQLVHAKMGSEGVGGGDLCEDRIKIVRDDLKVWIKKGGAQGLKLPADISIGQYADSMNSALASAKIRCVSAGDEGFPVTVDNIAKVCRFDSSDTGMISCDYTKFQAISQEDQYVLVHHEYAGLAGLEVPNGSDSNYNLSNQISGYLVNHQVKKLSVNPSQESVGNERDFRIDQDASIYRGYAIAWGIPGRPLDFEKLDNMSDEEILKFIDKEEVRNFIVRIKDNKILATLDSDMVDYHLGNYHVGNHFTLELSSLVIAGVTSSMDQLVVISNYKWSSELSKIMILDRYNPGKVAQYSTDEMNDEILMQMRTLIKRENMSLFDNGEINIGDIESVVVNNKEVNKISYNFAIPKSEGKTLDIVATIKLSLVNGKIVPKVILIKQSKS